MEKLQKIYPFVLFTIFVSIAFWDLPKTFFQQDEWWAFGTYILNESYGGLAGAIKSTIVGDKVHFTPLANVGYYLQYKLFGMNFTFYGFVSIFTHILNAFLVYCVSRMLIKNSFLSVFSALLFSVGSISHQAVTWIATSVNTQGATMFSLISIIFFLSYLKAKKQKFYLLTLSFASIVIALLFKETVLPFILIPMLWYFYRENKNPTHVKKIFLPFLVVFVLYVFIRIFVYIISPSTIPNAPQIGQQPGMPVYIYRLFTLPFKVIAQSTFPQLTLVSWSDRIVKLAYPRFIESDGAVNPYISQSIVFDFVGYIIATVLFFIAILSFVFLQKANKRYLANGVILSVCIMVAGALPIIFIPGQPGYASIIEPRHLYIGSIGSSMLIVVVVYSVFNFLLKQKRLWTTILTSIVLLSIVSFHSLSTRNDIEKLKQISFYRKLFLTGIEKDYRKLSKNVVFYTQSNKTYYGQPDTEKFLPVQFGFGKILMIWYQKKEQFPVCLYKDAFLDGLLSQGYRYCEGRGFGYFRDYDKLVEVVKTNGIDAQNIISYSWSGETKEFSDITQAIREKVKDDLQN